MSVKVAQGKAAGYIGPHIMDLMYWDLILDLVRSGAAVGINPYRPYSWCELLEKASNITNIHRHLARAYLIQNPFKSSLVASYRVLRSRASTMLFLVVQYEYRYLPAAVLIVPQESEGPVY